MLAIVMRAPLPPWSEFAIYTGLPPLGLPAVLLLVLLFNGFGEEAGWRGFALQPLQRPYGPVVGTLILGRLVGRMAHSGVLRRLGDDLVDRRGATANASSRLLIEHGA